MLYREDFSNIRFGASERNISARLAHHMENIQFTVIKYLITIYPLLKWNSYKPYAPPTLKVILCQDNRAAHYQ